MPELRLEEMNINPLKESRQPHVIDLLTKFARRKWALLGFIFGGGALFVAFTFIMPHEYSGLSTLIPPEKQSAERGLLSFLTGSGGALDILKAQENPALDMFENIIESRQVAEQVARDSAIHAYYAQWDTTERGIVGALQKSIAAEPLRNNMMNVIVRVKTPWMPSSQESEYARQLVPRVGNLFIHYLDRYNRENLMTKAKLTRIFIEKEFGARSVQLDSAYSRLQAFQETNKAFSLDDQLAATVSGAAVLASEVQQLEMQLAVEEREFSANSDRVAMIRARIEEARRQLKKYDDGSIGEYVIALKSMPEVGRELAGLMREVKMLEAMTAYLRQQLEQERISEQRDLPTIQVLDTVIAPHMRSSPRRFTMLLLGMFSGFFVSLFYIGWKDFRDDLRQNPEAHVRYLNFRSAIFRNGNQVGR